MSKEPCIEEDHYILTAFLPYELGNAGIELEDSPDTRQV